MSDRTSETTSIRRNNLTPWVPVAVAILLLVVAFWWTGGWMVTRWEKEGSYYSHGWLIPIVAAVLIFLKRKRIRECPIRPCKWGWLVIIPSLILHVLGTTGRFGFVSGFALIGVLAGGILMLFGSRMLRLTFFPIIFLAFMVPVPDYLIQKTSFNMKLLAAGAATGTVDVFGFDVVREGSNVYLPSGETLVVDDVCSGLKYLISLTAFAALYSHLSKVKLWGKALLFFLAVPIAIAANMVRVVLMLAVAYHANVQTVNKWYFHDLFGFVLFIVAFLLLFLTESLIMRDFRFGRGRRGRREESKETPKSEPSDQPPHPTVKKVYPSGTLQGILLTILGVVTVYSIYSTALRGTTAATDILGGIPASIGEWQGTEVPLSRRTLDILGTDDVLTRIYTDKRGGMVGLYIILAQQMKSRTHPPEQCLAGEGYSLEESQERILSLGRESQTGEIRFQELVYSIGAKSEDSDDVEPERKIVWYFFKTGEQFNTSYFRHQCSVFLRKFSNPDAEDMIIRADVSLPSGDTEAGRQVLKSFFSSTLPTILEQLP